MRDQAPLLISIRDAASDGIRRIRQPNWANPKDYLLIDILEDNTPGPWVHLYSPINQSVCQQRNPQDILWVGSGCHGAGTEKLYEPYTGDPDADERQRPSGVA